MPPKLFQGMLNGIVRLQECILSLKQNQRRMRTDLLEKYMSKASENIQRMMNLSQKNPNAYQSYKFQNKIQLYYESICVLNL